VQTSPLARANYLQSRKSCYFLGADYFFLLRPIQMNLQPAISPQKIPQFAQAVRISSDFSIDALSSDSVPLQSPGPGQVLVAIKAVSLNYRDVLVVSGKYSPNLQKPLTICSDAAGEVFAVGAGVQRFKPGDRVVASFFQNWLDGEYDREYGKSALGGSIDGVLCTHKLFREEGLLPLPSHLSFEEGSTLPCAALTAWHAMVPTARVKSGDTVLLLGTGGVSIFGLQLAKLHGARAIITSSSNDKLARAKSFGADATVNYRENPDWEKAVFKLTAGRGADIVLEVGGGETLPHSLRAVRPGGQVSLIGVLSGIDSALNIGPILHNNLRVQGIYVGSAAMFQDMNRAIAINGLKPVIDRTFSFAQSREALRYMQSGQHFGKIVITVEATV
jgi:NADPH:quinone reductase-like Zn-dependent oxidoreductase